MSVTANANQTNFGEIARAATVNRLTEMLTHSSPVARMNAVMELGERLRSKREAKAAELLETAARDANNRRVRLRGYTVAEMSVVELLRSEDADSLRRAKMLFKDFSDIERDTILWAAGVNVEMTDDNFIAA